MKSQKRARPEWKSVALREAEELGLLSGTQMVALSGRIPRNLMEAANRRSSARSEEELPLIALSVVATHDDFGKRLLDRKGSIDPLVDLEFSVPKKS
jgi:hypothetical protein